MPLSPKYVMLNGAWPVMFASNIGHDRAKGLGGYITSAGRFRLTINAGKIDVETFGWSNSLNLSPAPDDAIIIKIFLGLI